MEPASLDIRVSFFGKQDIGPTGKRVSLAEMWTPAQKNLCPTSRRLCTLPKARTAVAKLTC
jgi:hypothetical protein